MRGWPVVTARAFRRNATNKRASFSGDGDSMPRRAEEAVHFGQRASAPGLGTRTQRAGTFRAPTPGRSSSFTWRVYTLGLLFSWLSIFLGTGAVLSQLWLTLLRGQDTSTLYTIVCLFVYEISSGKPPLAGSSGLELCGTGNVYFLNGQDKMTPGVQGAGMRFA